MSERVFTWDYREQPPLAEILAAVRELGGGTFATIAGWPESGATR